MTIKFNLYPNGFQKALTMSYDDGQMYDLRLAALFDQNGIKGTFHLNSNTIDKPGYVSRNDILTVLHNHEISAHTYTHPHLDRLPDSMIIEEVMMDRKNLEDIIGYPVRGMSYPFGDYDNRIMTILKSIGIEYSRTVCSTNNFILPKNLLEWHPTCHHNNISDLFERFIEREPKDDMLLFYLWGHSYEFEHQNTWPIIEEFCAKAGNHSDIWYATNIEISDYLTALRSLKYSANHTMILNPTAIDVWLTIDNTSVYIKAGSTYYHK